METIRMEMQRDTKRRVDWTASAARRHVRKRLRLWRVSWLRVPEILATSFPEILAT
jgi:hypothetical protein